MGRSFAWACLTVALVVASGCNKRDEQKAESASERARQKLSTAGQELRAESKRAAVKLDRAAMIAKIKTKLATDAGLSTATSVDVDVTGQVVTLRGTVSSEDQKRQAERVVKQIDGVSRVIDDLEVKE